MKASRLCELREGFIREWQKDFPFVPPPALRGIDNVQESDVIDELQASGHIATLWGSVHAVNNKLHQLDEQVQRKERVRDFLIRLLQTFDENFEAKASALSKPSASSISKRSGTAVSVSGGASFVTVSSANRRPTLCEDNTYRSTDNNKVYSDKRGVLCVPDECAPASVCCNNNTDGPSQSGLSRKINTCEKSCSAEFTSYDIVDKVDIGIQCALNNSNSNSVIKLQHGVKSVGYKSVINHKVGSSSECRGGGGNCVSVNDRVTCTVDSGQNTEVCDGDSRARPIRYKNNSGDYVDEEKEEGEFHYDNNTSLREHSSSTMFRRKKGSGLLRPGDEGGSQRGSKDNFLAVTSQRKLNHEEPSSHQSNKDVAAGDGSGGSCSRGSSPSLTRNFQLLKLTSGFDLVLDDSDSNCSTDDQSGVDDSDKIKLNKTDSNSSINDNTPRQPSDRRDINLKPEETLLIRSVNDPTVLKDKTDSDKYDDEDDDDDTTPTPVDFRALKFDYSSGDVSKVLDSNPPDLVSSTLSNSTMLTNNNQTNPSTGDDNNQQHSSTPATDSNSTTNDNDMSFASRADPKRNSGGAPPPPVARKPSRPSTGKKLPSIPVGVEPVTRPLSLSSKLQQSQSSDSHSVHHTEPVALKENQRQSTSINIINPTSNLTKTNENNINNQTQAGTEMTDISSSSPSNQNNNLRSSSPSSSSNFLSSSPDFRSALTTGIIPATPQADIVIGQSNPKRRSNFYCDIDLDASLSSIPHDDQQPSRVTPNSQNNPDSNLTTEDFSGKVPRNSLSELVRGTNSTIIAISQSESSANSQSHSSPLSNQKEDNTSNDISNSCGELELEQNKERRASANDDSSSPPPPPLPKRESRVITSNDDGDACEKESSTNTIEVALPSFAHAKSNNKLDHRHFHLFTNTDGDTVHSETNNEELVFPAASVKQAEYSRMSSTDTLVGEQQQYPQHILERKRRSESFTSDSDVKDAIFAFDQIISAQCPDLVEELDSNTMESSNKPINRRRNSSVNNYENWTINRALTSSISSQCRSESFNLDEFNFINEGDDDNNNDNDNDTATTNDDDSSNASSSVMPSPDLSRPGYLSHGSKDSGLCDDMSVTDSMHSELDLTGGRISDLRQIQEMERWEEEEEASDKFGRKKNEYENVTPGHKSEKEMDYDSVSLASDIVFMTGSIAKKRQSQEDLTTDSRGDGANEDGDDNDDDDDDDDDMDGRGVRLDTSSTASSLEEGDGRSMNASYDEIDSGHEGILKMRQLLIKGVLDSEKAYLDILGLLIDYKKGMEASSKSSQPLISDADIQAIFGNIETLNAVHMTFVTSLEAKVKAWTHAECVGEIFKIFVMEFHKFHQYVNNYPTAVNTIHRCCQESERFQDIAETIVVNSIIKENIRLEDALFKPVQRVQRHSLVLHDLIKYTPEDHPDHSALQKALKLSQHNLESFAGVVPHANTNHENRRLVKSSFLVELVNGVRKLRYMFLFSDILICTKRETHRNNKVSFQIKWFAALADMTYDTKFAYKDDTKFSKKDDIHELKNKIRGLKKEMKNEMKKFDDKDKHRSLVNIGGAQRTVEKIRKKILQYEGQLILASPKLPFKVSLDNGKVYTMLMTTDYEKEEWKEALNSLGKRNTQRETQQPPFSSIVVQDLIDSVKETPQVNKIGNVLLQKDEDILTGTLNVTIHKMNGLTKECDTYCCLEMDSFGHFFMVARTKMCEASRDPNWNEDFELELEGSLTLRILCFMKAEGEGDGGGDQLLGRGALELDKQWLKGSFQEKTISMNEISLVVSVRHTPAEKTMQRTPSRTRSAVFGVEISSCARREGKTVPTIITACIKEVEKRGLEEVGIYRVSGVTSDLQRIKKLFDRNISAGASSLEDIDINAVTGTLKMYLRELPQPLFTEAAYNKFVGTLKLSDEEAKSQCVLRLLHELPDTNYYTIVYLLEHLVKVARYVGQNKMSIHNLATIFGPTLLAPASKGTTTNDPLALMWQGAEQVMQQSGVVSYLLGLAVSGRSLRRSSS